MTALCKVLQENAHYEDLLSMMTQVNQYYLYGSFNFFGLFIFTFDIGKKIDGCIATLQFTQKILFV